MSRVQLPLIGAIKVIPQSKRNPMELIIYSIDEAVKKAEVDYYVTVYVCTTLCWHS